MDTTVIHNRHVLLFRSGHSAAQAHRMLVQAHEQDVPSVTTCQRWFNKFSQGNFSVLDEDRSGRPTEVNDDELRKLIEADPRLTTRALADMLGCSHMTVDRHLREMGKVLKYGSWVPHELTRSWTWIADLTFVQFSFRNTVVSTGWRMSLRVMRSGAFMLITHGRNSGWMLENRQNLRRKETFIPKK